jgi:Ca2+-binding EF-hand superfamily protein
MAFDIYGRHRRIHSNVHYLSLILDQNKDGQINRKDMIKIIEAMYDLANEEDRTGEKAPDKRVELIMQRLNKEKSGTTCLSVYRCMCYDSYLSCSRCHSSK